MKTLRRMSWALGVVLATMAPAWTADEAAVPAALPPVTVEFDRTEIRDALRQLGALTGLNFVVADNVKGTMTARFVDQPLDRVLRLIAVTLDVAIERVDDVFVLKAARRLATEAETAAGAAAGLPPSPAAPATGAGLLLPGDTPQVPLREAGAPASPVAGAPGEVAAGAGLPADPRTRGEIPLQTMSPRQAAGLFGGGSVDAAGQYQPYQQPSAGHGASGWGQRAGNSLDPYRNLPPEARVTPRGAILMPNGTTILPSGVIVAPDGSVIQPGRVPYYQVPWGTDPNTLPNGQYPYNGYNGYGYPQQNQGTLSGSINGWQFGLGGQGGGLLPPTIQLGPNAQLQLPGVSWGANGIQVGPGSGYANSYPNYYPNQGYLSGQAPPSWYNYREYNGRQVTP